MPKLKDQLLNRFSQNIDQIYSGENLAEEYHVSRAAVWKAVKTLQKEGYDILSSAKGYYFTAKNDFLNELLKLPCALRKMAPVFRKISLFKEAISVAKYLNVVKYL